MLQFISRLRIVLALGWLAMVIFLTWLYLGGTAPPGAGGADKMLHTIAFAGATLPGVLAQPPQHPGGRAGHADLRLRP